ncbi:MAG: CTP synthase [Alphaproteobacteria bacterium]|nr:CTP synthase [Alphaproteobacteria bacterium]
MARFIFITGGVASSLGKGLSSASLGALLQAHGYKVRSRKLDPYLNVDPGLLSPYQHGEVYVTDDGAETDLDLGHYERFTGVSLRRTDSTTSGRIYAEVIAKEKHGDYNGGTIQIIPHITNAVKDFITSNITDEDFVICEIGGTVGDIESQSFIEAIRQLDNELPIKPMFIHLTLLPFIASAGELKTKPTQHSVKDLLMMGIQANLLLCRTEQGINEEEKKKIALFCNLNVEDVIPNVDASSLYELPLQLHKDGLDKRVLKYFGLPYEEPDLLKWQEAVRKYHNPKDTVKVAVVGKYVSMLETYKSLHEAIVHGAIANELKADINWVDAEEIETSGAEKFLHDAEAIIIPGGFGERGTEGKIAAATYARENKIPMLGISFGMQMAAVDIARNVLKLDDAGSLEVSACKNPVVSLLKDWASADTNLCNGIKDDTIRLGARDIDLKEGTKIAKAYGENTVSERHRNRYGINPAYEQDFTKAGVLFSGYSKDGHIIEALELKDHPWFIGVLYQPEFKSRVFAPHPLFVSLLNAAEEQKNK